MTENNQNRFIMPDYDDDSDVTLIDTATCEEYTYDFSKVVDKLNEINNELMFYKSREYAFKEEHFTKRGGFSFTRDGRGRYTITSENVIPKNSAIIEIKSPDTIWNNIIFDLIWNVLGKQKGGGNID